MDRNEINKNFKNRSWKSENAYMTIDEKNNNPSFGKSEKE